MADKDLTLRLRHAGPQATDCQLKRDPGVACSRLVRLSPFPQFLQIRNDHTVVVIAPKLVWITGGLLVHLNPLAVIIWSV